MFTDIRFIALALVVAVAVYFGVDYYNAKQDAVKGKVAVSALDTTKENTDAVNKIVNKSDQERRKLTTIVSGNKLIVDKLQQPARHGSDKSSEACRAEANKIVAYQEVFGECTRVLTEVAEAADEHVIDMETYKAAFAAIK